MHLRMHVKHFICKYLFKMFAVARAVVLRPVVYCSTYDVDEKPVTMKHHSKTIKKKKQNFKIKTYVMCLMLEMKMIVSK